MPANYFDEHQLAQSGQDAFAAGALVRRFRDCQLDELAKPTAIAGLQISSLDYWRKIVEKRIKRLSIAGEPAADELRRDGSIAVIVDQEWQLAVSSSIERARCEGIGPHAGTARHDMRITLREDDDFARFYRDGLSVEDIGEATAFSNHMIRDQMR